MKIKLSDYVINWLIEKEIDTVFSVSGGFIGHLLDSVNKKRDKLNYVCARHESNAGFMAYGYGKLKNKPAVALITNGPATTNILTSVVSAYQDSTPMIVISGQCYVNQTIGSDNTNLRQLGVQELDILPLITRITKYCSYTYYEKDIKNILEDAYYACMNSRKGPVWIEIPLDIQSKEIEISELSEDLSFVTEKEVDIDINKIYSLIKFAEKPLIIAGAGIKQSDCVNEFLELKDKLNILAVSTWGANDLFDYEDSNYFGCFGVMGRQSANLAIQNADLLLILGSRLSLSNVGYNYKDFAPNAKKIMVDCDWAELNKKTLNIDYKICADLKKFLNEMINYGKS